MVVQGHNLNRPITLHRRLFPIPSDQLEPLAESRSRTQWNQPISGQLRNGHRETGQMQVSKDLGYPIHISLRVDGVTRALTDLWGQWFEIKMDRAHLA